MRRPFRYERYGLAPLRFDVNLISERNVELRTNRFLPFDVYLIFERNVGVCECERRIINCCLLETDYVQNGCECVPQFNFGTQTENTLKIPTKSKPVENKTESNKLFTNNIVNAKKRRKRTIRKIDNLSRGVRLPGILRMDNARLLMSRRWCKLLVAVTAKE